MKLTEQTKLKILESLPKFSTHVFIDGLNQLTYYKFSGTTPFYFINKNWHKSINNQLWFVNQDIADRLFKIEDIKDTKMITLKQKCNIIKNAPDSAEYYSTETDIYYRALGSKLQLRTNEKGWCNAAMTINDIKYMHELSTLKDEITTKFNNLELVENSTIIKDAPKDATHFAFDIYYKIIGLNFFVWNDLVESNIWRNSNEDISWYIRNLKRLPVTSKLTMQEIIDNAPKFAEYYSPKRKCYYRNYNSNPDLYFFCDKKWHSSALLQIEIDDLVSLFDMQDELKNVKQNTLTQEIIDNAPHGAEFWGGRLYYKCINGYYHNFYKGDWRLPVQQHHTWYKERLIKLPKLDVVAVDESEYKYGDSVKFFDNVGTFINLVPTDQNIALVQVMKGSNGNFRIAQVKLENLSHYDIETERECFAKLKEMNHMSPDQLVTFFKVNDLIG